jgi:hypothetical protein
MVMLDALLGPLGAALGGILAVAAAWLIGKHKGVTGERERRAGQDAADYVNERQAIDETDLGHGASDAERIRMLSDIADRHKRGED